ncbi:MAG TPA: Hsp70 family protein, partial [Acidimicrobiales bacterium]
VLRSTGDGFTVVGAPGGDDRLGGEYFDERVYQHIGQRLGQDDPAAWENLRYSTDRVWARANATLRSEVRAAKEALSSVAEATVYVPSPVDREFRITRAELEALLLPDIERSVDEMSRTVTAAGLTLDALAAVYLVGGSSRIPLVARLVGERFGRSPSTWGDPKAVVALGAAATGRRTSHESPVALERPPATAAVPAATAATTATVGDAAPPRRNKAIAIIAGVLALLLVSGIAAVAMSGGDDDPIVTAGEVFLEPVSDSGPDPFTDDVGDDVDDIERDDETTGTTAAGDKTAIKTSVGTDPGLYGGTRDKGSCDTTQLVSFLGDNPALARAWTAVLGIAPDDVEQYVATLTPLVLRDDTRVTNHGYRAGKATPRQSVLEAGTAVLVDRNGVPRVKCSCGNPLVEPTAVEGTTRYTGDRWGDFSPENLAVYTEGPEVAQFVVTDVETGDAFVRPVGSAGEADVDAPDEAILPTDEDDSTATTSTTVVAQGGRTVVPLGSTLAVEGYTVEVRSIHELAFVCHASRGAPARDGCREDEFSSGTAEDGIPEFAATVRVCNDSVETTDMNRVASSFRLVRSVHLNDPDDGALIPTLSDFRDPTGAVSPFPVEGPLPVGDCREGALIYGDTRWRSQLNEVAVVFIPSLDAGAASGVWVHTAIGLS